MEKLKGVVDARYLEGYRLLLTFDDGAKKIVDMAPYIGRGVFQPLRDIEYFKKVRVNQDTDTIEWDNGADMDPEVLYEIAESAEINSRHKTDCRCPICKSRRGERQRMVMKVVKYPREIIDRWGQKARETGLTEAEIARRALSEWLDKAG